jgi:hypothetical protein
MAVPVDGNLHRLADDLPQHPGSAAARMAWLHGGEVLQRERDEREANEQQWMAREGQSRFILSEWARSRVHTTRNNWASWVVLWGGVVR